MIRHITLSKYNEIRDHVYNYPTKNKEGFLPVEEEEVLKSYPEINIEKYDSAMHGNTCMIESESGQIIMYHCDVLQAIICGLENRELRVEEWD